MELRAESMKRQTESKFDILIQTSWLLYITDHFLSPSLPMASFTATSISMTSLSPASFKQSLAPARISNPNLVSFSIKGRAFPSFTLQPRVPRFQVTCAAKPETVDKVCAIVKKQLALPDGTTVSGESKFTELGADSLDTVEIVMGLEEEFGISVEEDSAQAITTVQEAADMIEKLAEKN